MTKSFYKNSYFKHSLSFGSFQYLFPSIPEEKIEGYYLGTAKLVRTFRKDKDSNNNIASITIDSDWNVDEHVEEIPFLGVGPAKQYRTFYSHANLALQSMGVILTHAQVAMLPHQIDGHREKTMETIIGELYRYPE